MPSIASVTPDDGYTVTHDTYTGTRSSIAGLPVYKPEPQVIPGQSKYATPEAEALAKPYAGVGDFSLNLLPTTPGPPLPGTPAAPAVSPPVLPSNDPNLNAQQRLGLSNTPFGGVLGGGIDFLSHLVGPVLAQEGQPGIYARSFYDKLKNTPDAQLTPAEVQAKQLNQGLFGVAPDSPMMQGKQISEMYKAFLVADAHSKGGSAVIQAQTLGEPDFTPVGAALQGYALVSGLLRRAIGGGVVDQLQVLRDTSDADLGPERAAIKKAWTDGDLNDAEARDSIAMSSFALTNPNPIKATGTPIDTVANAAISFIGDMATDPVTYAMAFPTGGASLAKGPIEVTLRSILREVGTHVAEEGGADLTSAAARSAAEEAGGKVAAGEAERVAGEHLAQSAFERHLPKGATAAVKQGATSTVGLTDAAGNAIESGVTQADRLQALLRMGADDSHPWSAAIKRGVENAGMNGQIATKAPRVLHMAEAMNKVIDPFSLFGYWRTGKVVPMMGSMQAAHGFLDGVGWRVAQRLDGVYRDAGVNPDLVDKARTIAGANHAIQAGDRANTQRMVAQNSMFTSGMTPTEQAARHMARRPGDIRSLVRDQVGKTLEFIVPRTKGGLADETASWRQRAAKQLRDFGATPADARATAAKMDERTMRALANDHWGLMIDGIDEAKRTAKPTAKWDQHGIDRMTFMAPRQMADQDATRIAKDLADGNVSAVRRAVNRFRDLNQNISESLPDDELMAETKRILAQIDKPGQLPTRIEDMTDMPQGLVNWTQDHPDYGLFLRPDDDKLLVPIRNLQGDVVGANTWIDHVTDRVGSVEINTFKAAREGLLRNIAGGELERNVNRRFATTMAETQGLSEAESNALGRTLKETARISDVSPRGLRADQINEAVDRAPILTAGRKVLAKRSVADAWLSAYENELALVGALPKLTGWVKTQAGAVGGNALGWITDGLYSKFRFNLSGLFFIQEVPEAPFWLALQGRYPLSSVVPDFAVRGLEAIPGPTRKLGEIIAGSKESRRIWDDKTLTVMDILTRTSPYAESDAYASEEITRMGLHQAQAIVDARTPLGKLLAKTGTGLDLRMRKFRSVALAARAEYGEMWKRSLLANAPEQWNAVRAFYPDAMDDNEVAIQWALDAFSRANPDSIYAKLSPELYRPSHIGARAEVSDQLLRHFVYGADAPKKTWANLVQDIKDRTVSIEQVRGDLQAAGADPDYVERAIHKLTFGSPEEFYSAAIENGIPVEEAAAWHASNLRHADMMGISEGEYLARTYAGRPLAVDQMGNHVGYTLFDDIIQHMRIRGKVIPESDSADVALLKQRAHDFISDVFPHAPVPDRLPRGATAAERSAANKARGWEKTHGAREVNPFIGAPPTKNIGEQVAPAYFGFNPDTGNRVLPDAFTKEEPGFLYRIAKQGMVGNDWQKGTFAGASPDPIHALTDDSVLMRVRKGVTGWDPAVGGVNAGENATSQARIPASAIEVLGEDGRWRPVEAPTAFPEPLYQTPLHTIGMPSVEQYTRQIEMMTDPIEMGRRGMTAMSEKDVKNAIEWYDHMRRSMFALVPEGASEEERIMAAARHLVSFGTTQLNTSPADGLRHVFKAQGMVARGETLQLGEARNILQQAVGLNPEQLHALIWNDDSKISQMGIAQKLFDFIDSLTGSDLRTNGVLGPNGDWGPVAVDVHTKRDFGYLDEKMADWVYRLVEKEGPNGELIRGTSSKFTKGHGFDIEMSDGTTEHIPMKYIGQSVPTDAEYDYGVEFANNVRDHWNATNFMKRQWTSYEVQALGWYRMQLLKSSEGDAGTVANAMFEQSRWMGSGDLSPSIHAPMGEVHPWNDVTLEHHRAIVNEGMRDASNEAERMSGAHVLTRLEATARTGDTHQPAQTVELLTDPTGAEQYLAHALYLGEQDRGTLMRDMVGKPRAPKATTTGNITRGTGISVDIPVESADHADELMQTLAPQLQAIGSHSYVAQAADGSLHIRTLWEPTGAGDRNAFKKALTASRLGEQPGMAAKDVEFISMHHDWAADPNGSTYLDAIQRGSGKHGVMRSPEQRQALVEQYDAAYVAAQDRAARAGRMRDSNPKKAPEVKAANAAVASAKKEMEVARAAPNGLPAGQVSQLVGGARLRVRTNLAANFDKFAAREVRNARERVIGEARDAATAAGRLDGTDARWDDVLDATRGSNGERLYDRTPGGTVRAAIVRSDSAAKRDQLFFNRPSVTPKSLLHELVHKEALSYDDSANKLIHGVHSGLEGVPQGDWIPGTPLTEAEHEWLVSQHFLWAQNEDNVHPVMAPLHKYLHDQLGSQVALRSQATGPSRDVIRQADADIATLTARRATVKRPGAAIKIDDQIAALQTKKAAAQQAAKEIRATGGIHPDIKKMLDDLAAQAGQRTETRASVFHPDEQNMLEWAQINALAAQRRANDLVHMRGERSALERSINHPFLGIYPSSYTLGKVLPHLAEFLMFRPFGMKAPFEAWTMSQSMMQSFNRQQQYDPNLRNFLYKNEPFLRAMGLLAPGVPWDLNVHMPLAARAIIENWMTNNTRALNGQKAIPLDWTSTIMKMFASGMSPRGATGLTPDVQGLGQDPGILNTMLTGKAPPVLDTAGNPLPQLPTTP